MLFLGGVTSELYACTVELSCCPLLSLVSGSEDSFSEEHWRKQVMLSLLRFVREVLFGMGACRFLHTS